MGRAPCCSKVGLHRGPWTAGEDTLLINYITANGEGHWRSLPKQAGLLRCGKSCRLRWMNYLRPGIKRGNITPEEDDLIIRLHSLLGNRWSLIAGRLPGRTDNEIKNYWNSHLSKRFNKRIIEKADDRPRKNTQNKVMKGGRNQVQESENEESKESTRKIHRPKPVRLSSTARNCTVKIGDFGEGETNVRWSEFDFQAGEEDEEDIFCGFMSSSSGQSFMPADADNDKNMLMLEEIIDEYDQLIQTDNNEILDSFVDSLLI